MPNSSTKTRIEPSPEMRPVLKKLKKLGFWYIVHTPHHLKVGNVNYYPSTGRIYVDGARKAFFERGVDALIQYLVFAKEAARKSQSSETPGPARCLTLSQI